MVNPLREERPPSLRRGVLKGISDQGMAWAARKFIRAGWDCGDVAWAVDHLPSGRQHRFTAEVRFPRPWLVSRLARWLDASGRPVLSRGQQLAAQRDRLLAEQEARRREREVTAGRAAGVDVAARAAELRAIIAGCRTAT